MDNGTCGDNARYTLFENGLLRISGYGDMYNYESMGDFYWLAPWFQVIDDYVDMPAGITRVEIADDITSLGGGSLSFSNIKELNISKNITSIAYDALRYCDLEHITVDEDNSSYCAVNDVLFSKDMKLLHTYARNKSEQHYTIPDGVEEINQCAFWKSLQLSSVMFPKTIKKINSRAFAECNPISDIYFNGTEDEWKLIDIANFGNTALKNATIHYNATGINPPQIAGIPTVKDNGDGTYTINMQIENAEYDSKLIAALYDNNVMTGITSNIISADNIPKTIIVTADNANTARLFIWSSIAGLQPLCKIVDAEFIKE